MTKRSDIKRIVVIISGPRGQSLVRDLTGRTYDLVNSTMGELLKLNNFGKLEPVGFIVADHDFKRPSWLPAKWVVFQPGEYGNRGGSDTNRTFFDQIDVKHQIWCIMVPDDESVAVAS